MKHNEAEGKTEKTIMAAKKSSQHIYDESKIKTLSSLEHIRMRTGMYIGRVGDGKHYEDGIYILLKEIIDNAVDEFIMGYGRRINLTIRNGTEVRVRDYGRGIPLGKLVECVSTINTGAKYNDEVFQFSVGLNGVGSKAVNALSQYFLVRSHRDGKFAEARFERGRLLSEKKGRSENEPDGTFVEYVPDCEIFGKASFEDEHVRHRLRLTACLNTGLTLNYNDTPITSRDGLFDLVRDECLDEELYPPLHVRHKTLELAFTHTQRFNETHFSFVNGQYTSDGGTHLSAFREGVLKAVNEYSKNRYDGDDMREGMVGAVAIRLMEPVFESQTKNKLGNTEIRAELVGRIRDVALDLLHRHPDRAERLLAKAQETARMRKELQSVKKMARERARAISLRIPQLRDSKLHLDSRRDRGKGTMIFIVEGQSAAGSIVSCRDVNTQAIYTLKGKPLNVCDLKREAIYKNDEMYNLMRALNIEDDTENVRYERVILATDADVDGLHIRNLLITFFLRFFEPLVARRRLYILETPLYRARTRKETVYCYSEKERDSVVKQMDRSCVVTRFKGLGEISPDEFKDFIGPAMKITAVEPGAQHDLPPLLSFYMGKNTQQRRQYIMDNLVVDATA